MRVYIPLNKEGIKELEACVEEETNNMKIIEFSAEDYFYLETKKYLDFLNVECEVLIDLYEDENIPNDKLNNAIEITRILRDNSSEERFVYLANKFIDIFKLAKKCNTYVNIYCYGDPNV